MSDQPSPPARRLPTTRAFDYVLTLLSMGIAVFALSVVLHNLVDIAFDYTQDTPHPEGRRGLLRVPVTFAAASLVVALPIFVGLFLRLRRAEAREPGGELDRGSRLAVQVVLAVAILWGVSRLVLYIYSLLNPGAVDLFQRSILASPIGNLVHIVVTLGLTGAVVAYWWGAPRPARGPRRTVLLTGLTAAGCVAAVVVQAVLARPIVADRALGIRISQVTNSIDYVFRQKGSIPADLSEFPEYASGVRYTPTGPRTYTLCVTWATASVDRRDPPWRSPGYVDRKIHPAGQVCYPMVIVPPGNYSEGLAPLPR